MRPKRAVWVGNATLRLPEFCEERPAAGSAHAGNLFRILRKKNPRGFRSKYFASAAVLSEDAALFSAAGMPGPALRPLCHPGDPLGAPAGLGRRGPGRAI